MVCFLGYIIIKRSSKNPSIKRLKLSKEDARKMGKKKLDKGNSIAEIKGQNLPKKSERAKMKEINSSHGSDVRDLIGDKKYSQQLAYNDAKHERIFKKAYSVTNEQYNKYKDLENARAIKLKEAKQSKLSPSDKKVKISEIQGTKVEEMKSVLVGAQFDKWHKSYLKSQAKKTATIARKKNKL